MPSDPQKIESFLSKLEKWNEKCQTGVTIEGPHALFAANVLKEAHKLLKVMRIGIKHCSRRCGVYSRGYLSEVAKLLSESEGK